MSSVGIFSAHLQKLAHPIREIRERALLQLIAKIKYGFDELDDELGRTRELMEVLLGWFRFEEPSLQNEALNLLLTTIKSKTGTYIIKESGAQETLTQLEAIHNKVDASCEQVFQDVIDTLRFLSTVQSEDNIRVPQLNIPSTSSSEHEFAARKDYDLQNLNFGSSGVSTFNSEDEYGHPYTRSAAPCIRVLLLPWLALSPADSKTLALMEDALQMLKSTRRCCRFIKDVFVRDFPAEVFLNRPALVKKLHSLLGGTSQCTEVLEVLLSITKSLAQRIRQLNCPEFKHNKTEVTDNGSRLNQQTEKEIENLAVELDCDGGLDARRLAEDDGTVLNQLPVPYYCLDTLIELLKAMASSLVVIDGGDQAETFGVAELNVALALVENLTRLLLSCVREEFWLTEHGSRTRKDVAHRSFVVMRLLGELISQLRVSWQSAPERKHHRAAMLRLVAAGAALARWARKSALAPPNLVSALQPVLADMPAVLLYPGLDMDIIQDTRLLANEEFSKKHKEISKLCSSIESTTQFMRDRSCHNSKAVVGMIKSSLPALELHNSETLLKDVATILLKKIKEWTLEESELSDARKACLTLMSHPQEWVRAGFYKMMAETVVAVLAGGRAETEESCLHLLFDVGILTELCCHGLSSKSKQVLASASDVMMYLMRGRLVLSERCWWRLLSSLLPVMPLLHCYAAHDTLLGEAVMQSLEAKISECMGVPRAELVAGRARLLFVRCPAAQSEAAHNLCRMLIDEDENDQYLPTRESIRADILLTALRRVEAADLNVDYNSQTNKNEQTAGLIQMLELLKQDFRLDDSRLTGCGDAVMEEPTLEPSLRRSTLQRLAVVMQQPGLHEAFLQHGGLKLICEHLKLSLLVADYLTFPECAKSCVSILNGLSFTSTTTRQTLAKHQDLMLLLVRGVLVFPTDAQCVRLSAQLLFVLSFSGFILQELDQNRRRVFSLPHCVVQRTVLPFPAQSYWHTSTNTVHSPAEWILEDDTWKSVIRHRWTLSWYSPSHVLRWASPPPVATLPFPHHLLLTERELDMLRGSCPVRGSLAALMMVQNATSHKMVDRGLAILTGYTHLLSLSGIEKNIEEYNALPWRETFTRFLNSAPASPRDVALLTRVLNFMVTYLDNVVVSDPTNNSWITATIIDNETSIITLLHTPRLFPGQTPAETIEIAQLQTCIVRILLRSCMRVGQTARWSANKWESLVKILLVCLDGVNLKDFHMLGYLNELVRCLRYIICSPQCVLSSPVGMQAWRSLTAATVNTPQRDKHYTGFKGQALLLDVLLALVTVLEAERSDDDAVEWFTENGQGSEGEWLSLVGACAATGQVQLRAAGLHLLAGLARQSQALHLIDQALERHGGSCVGYAMGVLCDATEASAVRAAAAALLVNATAGRHAATGIFQSDLAEHIKNHNFLDAAIQILVDFCSNKRRESNFESNIPLEVLERKEQYEVLLSKGSWSGMELPHATGDKPEPTGALVAALADLLHNLVSPSRQPLWSEWNQQGLFRMLFRCIYYNGDAESALQLRTSVCRALCRAARACADTRHTLIHTHDCLHALIRHMTTCREELRGLWAEGAVLMGVLMQEDNGKCVMWSLLLESDTERYWCALVDALSSDNAELQQAASYCLTQLMEAVRFFNRVQQKLAQPAASPDFFEELRAPSAYPYRSGGDEGLVDCQPEFLAEVLCLVLLEQYAAVTTAERIKELGSEDRWLSLCSCAAALLASSERARLYAVHRDLPTVLLGSLQAVRNYLTIDGQPLEIIRAAKKSPVLRSLHWLLVVMRSSMCACASAKERYADGNLSYSLNKLWPWLMMTEPLRDAIVHLLDTFTNNCPKAWAAMHNCVAGRCLLLEVVSLVCHEMAARSPTRAVTRLTGALRILTHCTPHLHCRTIILKSEVLSSVNKLHPALARGRTAGAWGRAEAAWERAAAALARHSDAAVRLLELRPVLCALALQRGRMLRALCLLAFAQGAKVKLLHSAEILHVWASVLGAPGDAAGKVAVGCALWALAANNHKAKLVLRTTGLSARLGSCVQRLRHSRDAAPDMERALQLLTYAQTVLQIN